MKKKKKDERRSNKGLDVGNGVCEVQGDLDASSIGQAHLDLGGGLRSINDRGKGRCG